jgi:hypothetical protein
MEIMLIAVIAVFLLGAFSALATEVGVDSRDLSDDPHRSSYPVSIS